ncbi:hypothetical protein AQUSIP_03300 [Aquicella siphonis]|uniref:Aminoglycoside phosphotransferase domain-containing protein n=1 Tax=Aquicella siphonis TaxID=254247 RepID=A0A5E4PEM4_9COXI|nr:phosphotransferase [Aquicella siphonis]VVC75055.1 hypothetical protein AQUSIP_03300 [Aquicella siphonis]
MESAQSLKIAESNLIERRQALEDWLKSACGLYDISLQPMPGDASLRRYFRLQAQERSFVVMDAPPPQENVRPFAAISRALRGMGLQTPEIFQADNEQGFLLLTDFGDATYLRTLHAGNAGVLYQRALDALAVLQSCRLVSGHAIPPFTADFMWKEWAWHKEWVMEKLLGLALGHAESALDACYRHIVETASAQPQVFMHRDYHSANLMVLESGETGILDFQDAFIGPVTYDLVSLLRDCYIDWPDAQVQTLALCYAEKLQALDATTRVSRQDFLYWFDLMGLQRHLKALLTFARKHVRDHQPRYLEFVPRTMHYLLNVSQRYPELSALHVYLRDTLKPALSKVVKSSRVIK